MIYDLRTNKAYNLNETLKILFRECNGQTTSDDLKHRQRNNILKRFARCV